MARVLRQTSATTVRLPPRVLLPPSPPLWGGLASAFSTSLASRFRRWMAIVIEAGGDLAPSTTKVIAHLVPAAGSFQIHVVEVARWLVCGGGGDGGGGGGVSLVARCAGPKARSETRGQFSQAGATCQTRTSLRWACRSLSAMNSPLMQTIFAAAIASEVAAVAPRSAVCRHGEAFLWQRRRCR